MIRLITKTILLASASLFLFTSSFAGNNKNGIAESKQTKVTSQTVMNPVLSSHATNVGLSIPASIDAAPGVVMPTKGKGQGFNKAPFDIDLQINLFDSITPGSYTGVTQAGSEIWVSRWNTDTLTNMTPSGGFISKFRVTGVANVRALTTDGTNIYAGSAGQAIFEINPVTKTLISTIALSGTVGARMCAYDPNANGGNGGFWIGNFTSAIQLISRTGAILTTIPQATHGIAGIYGGAVDITTPGGPYLLVYAQDGASQNTIHWINLNTNTPTGISYDVNQDVPVAGIAGGLGIVSNIVTGEQHIVTITQEAVNGNILTAYERGLPPAPPGEIELLPSALGGVLNYALVPSDQATSAPQALTAVASPVAGGPFDSAQITTTLSPGAIALASPFATVNPGTPVSLTTGTFTPASGTNYTGTITLTSTQDTDPTNNSYTVDMTVSDTVLARENATVNGGQLSFSATNYIGNVVEVLGQDTLTSLTAYFTATGGVTYPITTSLAFLDYNSGPGNFAIVQTPVFSVAGPGFVTVPVSPVVVSAGTYFVGAQEQGVFLPLGTDTSVSYPGVSVGGPLGGVNIDVTAFGFTETFMVRANFAPVVPIVLSPFTLLTPPSGTRLDITGLPSQTANITWNASTPTPAAPVTYEWLLDLQGGNFSSPLATIPSNSGGTATSLTLTFAAIDNLLGTLGVAVGDSVETSWTVRANSTAATLLATTPFNLKIVRSGLGGSRDFEAYNAGDLIVASDPEWAHWPGANLDAPVSTAQSQSGTNSLLINGAPAQDLLFLLGDLTSGVWGAGFSMYVPTGSSAYYNIQETQSTGVNWVIGNVNFDNGGLGQIDGFTPAATFQYPHNQWFDVRHYIDLDNDSIQIFIDGNFVKADAYTGSAGGALQLGAFNFYPDGANGPNKTYYLDDMYLQVDSLRTIPAPDFDAAINGNFIVASGLAGYAQVPPSQNDPSTFTAIVTNNGDQTITNVTLNGTINPGANAVTGSTASIGGFGAGLVTTNGFSANQGSSYTGNFNVTITEFDADPANNTAGFNFVAGNLVDSTFARENAAAPTNSLGFVGANVRAGVTYTFTSVDTITSITYFVNAVGDPIELFVSDFNYQNATSTTDIYTSGTFTPAAAGANTVAVNIPVTPGTYIVGAIQTTATNFGLGHTNTALRNGTSYTGIFPSWTDQAGGNFPGTWMIRLGLSRTNQPVSLSPFNLTSPPDGTRLEVESGSATPVVITWAPTVATPTANVTYRWLLDVQGGNFASPLLDFASDNGGVDPQITLTSGAIDAELANLGINAGDSVDVIWTVRATANANTALAANGPFDIRLVRNDGVGISTQLFESNVKFYPNPSNGELVIEVKDNLIQSVQIQNMLGQTLKSFNEVGSRNVLNLSDLSNGMYLVRFVSNKGDYTQKLIIE